MGKPENQPGEVYVVRAQTVGLVKIGLASRAEQRLKELQMSGPDLLRVIAVLPTPNSQELERALHDRFSWLRVHGEWFRPAPIMLWLLRTNPKNDPTRVAACQAHLDKVIAKHARKLKMIRETVVDDMPPFWPGGPAEEARRWPHDTPLMRALAGE